MQAKPNSKIALLEKELKSKDFKINSILEITNAINSNQTEDYLLSIIKYILKEHLEFNQFILFIKQEKWKCKIKEGNKATVKDISIKKDLKRFKKTTLIESSNNLALNAYDIVIPVIHKEEAIAYLILKQNSDQKTIPEKQLKFIQTITNIIIVAIENKYLYKEKLKQEGLKKELEIASEMQKQLFPSDLPSNHKMHISAKYLSRHQVGGDYYDFIQIDNNEYIMCIADVSGKGVSAALLMANFQATIRTLYNIKKYELIELIEQLNKKVMESAKGEKFITFFIAKYNSKNKKLQYINAGHNHPILTNGKKIKLLNKGSVGLGMFDKLPYVESEEVKIESNSTLIMYTDGVVELENEKGILFESENLIQLITNYYPLQVDDLNELIFKKLEEWKGKLNYTDDTAILSCRMF